MKQLKLHPHEKKLIKALNKILPIEASCTLSFHRAIYWSEAAMALGINADGFQDLRLRIRLYGDDSPAFEWEGKKLEEGVRSLHQWLQVRKQLSVAVVPKALPAAPPLSLAGGAA
jgi:hypothetical protein